MKSINMKSVLKEAAKEKRKIRYNDRQKVEIVEDTKHYKKGMIVSPHKVVAEALISQKIAKEVK